MSSSAVQSDTGGVIRSLIPARIDRLPWSGFHTRLVVALGVAWILDSLEISVASAVEGALTKPNTLNMSAAGSTTIATIYLIGEVVGALVFGMFADRWGRRKLFMITLGVYLVGSGLSAATSGAGNGWIAFLYLTRFIAGTGIGGEYAAINSAIDELIPARYRGRIDIAVNGTYWAGAFLSSVLTIAVIKHLDVSYSWRVGFLFGPVLGLVILFVRRNLPESPRWLVMRGRVEEAEEAIARIEEMTLQSCGTLKPVDESKAIVVLPADSVGYWTLTKTLFRRYPSRSVLGATLMITQSFLYNAIFFTYSLVLTKIYGVSEGNTAYYFMAFALGNLLGPLLLGHLFDTIGRRKMITGTYLIAGVALAISALLFHNGQLTAFTQTVCWCFVFFFASAGASAAYLTVSEIFPVEVRAKATAVFFALAQCVGSFGQWFYGKLIGDTTGQTSDYLGHHSKLWIGYLIGAVVMIAGAVVEFTLGVDAEGKSLEDVATPLTAVGESGGLLSNPTGAP